MDKFSIGAAVNTLKGIYSKKANPFTGFHWKSQNYKNFHNNFLEGPVSNAFYGEVYGNYSTSIQ